jgi:hypothetical protein
MHARGMAVGLASGLAAVTFTALLPDALAYIYVGAQLPGWYPPFCVVADVVIGVSLVAGWVV